MNDWIPNYFYQHLYCIDYEFSELIAYRSYICIHIKFFFTQSKHPRFTGKNLEKNKILYHRIENLAAKHGCTSAQLALAWLLHQGDDVVPIPGKSLYAYVLHTQLQSSHVPGNLFQIQLPYWLHHVDMDLLFVWLHMYAEYEKLKFFLPHIPLCFVTVLLN